MTRQLRRGRDTKSGSPKTGLILANGGNLTYQHVICLSSSPRSDGSRYPGSKPLPDTTLHEIQVPQVEQEAEGDATVEVSLSASRMNTGERHHLLTLTFMPWKSMDKILTAHVYRHIPSPTTAPAHQNRVISLDDCERPDTVSSRTTQMQTRCENLSLIHI